MIEVKKINYNLFLKAYNMCTEILDKSSIICEKEKNYRKESLKKTWKEMIANDKIDKQFYEKMHEIKSLEFLSDIDDLIISNDHLSTKGPDFKIGQNIWIECVTSSCGEGNKCLLKKTNGFEVFEYTKNENLILCRLTGSIDSKRKKFNEYIESGVVNKKDKNVIFLSAGSLYSEAFFGDYGFVLNKVLFGVNHRSLAIDQKTNKIVENGYTYNKEIFNHNNSSIDCNIFMNKSYEIISGIIFSYASLDEHYTKENTFYFRNPNAKNKVSLRLFNKIIYWNIWNKNGEYLYVPRCKGKNLNDKLNEKKF